MASNEQRCSSSAMWMGRLQRVERCGRLRRFAESGRALGWWDDELEQLAVGWDAGSEAASDGLGDASLLMPLLPGEGDAQCSARASVCSGCSGDSATNLPTGHPQRGRIDVELQLLHQ